VAHSTIGAGSIKEPAPFFRQVLKNVGLPG
jgi:hypothetical protein